MALVAQRRALVKLRGMYKEINDTWLKAQRYPGSAKWADPYRALEDWPTKMTARFIAVARDDNIGLEFLVVAMHADSFQQAMLNDTDEDWSALRAKVSANKYSLRMFVLMRKVQYAWYYNRTGFAESIGHLDPYPLYRGANLPHPHEVYLTASGDIRRCEFTNEGTKTTDPIADITENIYEEREFKRAGRPATWPKKWPYPFHPQYGAKSENEPFNRCDHCKRSVVPNIAFHNAYRKDNDLCTCQKSDWLSDPIVEIIEYASYGFSGLNRGVRALCEIKQDAVIGEYMGTFIPLQLQHLSGDDWYVMDFDGPPDPKIKGGYGPRTSLLASGLRGGWARFMNDARPKKTFDTQFYPEIVGGKQRIVVNTKRPIKFGTEIKTSYGPGYFMGETKEETIQKAERKRVSQEKREGIKHRLRNTAIGIPYPLPNPPASAGGSRLVTAFSKRRRNAG